MGIANFTYGGGRAALCNCGIPRHSCASRNLPAVSEKGGLSILRQQESAGRF